MSDGLAVSLTAISHVAATAAIAGLWQGAVLVVAVRLGLRLLPRAGATGRFAVWAAAFCLLAVTPLLPGPERAAAGNGGAAISVTPAMCWTIAAAWAGLAMWRCVRLARQVMALRGIAGRARPVAAGRQSAVPLFVSAEVEAPSLVGFWRPRLVLPEWMPADLTEEELEQVVLHEREHLRRGDAWVNLLQKVVLALFPLNPVLLWMDRQMGLERELACDDGVVLRTGAPVAYARCLTRLAGMREVRRQLALVVAAWSRRPELAERVYALLAPGRMPVRRAGWSLMLLGGALAGGEATMSRLPSPLRFASGEPAIAQSQAPVVLPQGTAVPAGLSPVRAVPASLPMMGGAGPRLMDAVLRTDGGADSREAAAGMGAGAKTDERGPGAGREARRGTVRRLTARAASLGASRRVTSGGGVRESVSLRRGAGNVTVVLTAADGYGRRLFDQAAFAPVESDMPAADDAASEDGAAIAVDAAPAIRVLHLIFMPTYAAVSSEDGWLFLEI